MRLSPPPYPAGAFDYRAWLESAIDRYEHVVGRLARPLGIRLLVETHAGGAASSPGLAWNIVERFDPADMGVIFDLGNFAREGEVAPGLAVSVLCHWIDCVHVGGSRRAEAGDDELGCRRVVAETCPPQESDLHLPSWLSALRDAGLDPPLIIEDFSSKETGPAKLVRDAFLLRRLAQGLR
jgi:sugar phosphate isomerase/epimerase